MHFHIRGDYEHQGNDHQRCNVLISNAYDDKFAETGKENSCVHIGA